MGEHVLVFGPELTAKRLIARLQALGLQVVTAKDYGIRTTELSELRRGLEAFSKEFRGGIVHPGTSHFADRIEIPLLCQEFELTYLGPSPRALNAWINRFQFLSKAQESAIPHLRMGIDPMHSYREVVRWVENNEPSFPFLLKAAQGRGIFGSTLVESEEDFEMRVPLWLEQLQNKYSDIILYFERFRDGMRRFTLPFVKLSNGEFVDFPVVDSSLQFSFNRWVEICPPLRIAPEAYELMRTYAKVMVDETHYVGVGLVEFLVDGNQVFLEEGTPHLNMAYHLWESLAKSHAVDWQLAAAGLSPAPALPPHAGDLIKHEGIEVALRIDAEDPFRWIPQTGKILEAERVQDMDLDLSQNRDGPVALLYVRGNRWSDVVQNAVISLQKIWITGELQTNERFLLELLAHPWFKEGVFHTQFLDEEFIPQVNPPTHLVQWAAQIANQIDSDVKKWSAFGKRWIPGTQTLNWAHPPLFFQTDQDLKGLNGRFLLPEDKMKSVRVCFYPISERFFRVRMGSWTFTLRGEPLVAAGPKLFSLVTGKVYFRPTREDEVVPAHRPVIFIESQGALIPHSLPVNVKIKEWKTKARAEVRIGQELADLEVIR